MLMLTCRMVPDKATEDKKGPAYCSIRGYSIVNRFWPMVTLSPVCTKMDLTLPSLGVDISCSIFIASHVHKISPVFTVAPN